MSKNSLKIAILCILTPFFIMPSCALLDVDSEDLVTRNEFYTTLGDAWAIKIGLYGSMQNLMEQYFVLGELRGDLVTPARGAKNNPDMLEFMEHNISPDNKYLDWSGFYHLINQCNDALVSLPVIKANVADFEDHWYNHIIGEVLWIRAWAYLTLVKNWGDVPFITEPVYSVQDVVAIQPTCADCILDQLEADLAWAVRHLIMNWAWARLPTYWNHETVNMAAGVNLLGDVLLHRDKYEQAWSRSALRKVIDPAVFDVQPNGSREFWNNSFNLGRASGEYAPNGESWFAANFRWAMEGFQGTWTLQGLVLAFDTESSYDGGRYNLNHTLGKITSNRPEWGEQYIVKPSVPAVENWLLPARDQNRGERYSYFVDRSVEPYDTLIWKYIGIDHNGNRRGNNRETGSGNINIHRVADLYFRGAEAAARLGIVSEAIEILRQSTAAVVTFPPFINVNSSIEAVEDAIMKERAQELAFEMYRWYDLVRIAKRRDDPNYLIDKVVAARPAEIRDEIRARLEFQSENLWKLPYGSRAVRLNPALLEPCIPLSK